MFKKIFKKPVEVATESIAETKVHAEEVMNKASDKIDEVSEAAINTTKTLDSFIDNINKKVDRIEKVVVGAVVIDIFIRSLSLIIQIAKK